MTEKSVVSHGSSSATIVTDGDGHHVTHSDGRTQAFGSGYTHAQVRTIVRNEMRNNLIKAGDFIQKNEK